jgi:hypothetical protein
MSIMDTMIHSWKQEQALLQRQLAMLESGLLKTHERRWPDRLDLTDTTAETKERVRRNLAQYDSLLSEYSS